MEMEMEQQSHDFVLEDEDEKAAAVLTHQLQHNPQTLQLPPPEPTMFDVKLNMYPMQPWQRAQFALRNAKTQEQFDAAKAQLRQWFNYDLLPESWALYAERQQKLIAQLRSSAVQQQVHTRADAQSSRSVTRLHNS